MKGVIDGKRFRVARKAAGYKTQAALAKKCKCAEITVGRIERGELMPGPDLVKRLSAAIRTDVQAMVVPVGTPATEGALLLSALDRLPARQQDFIHALVLALCEGGTLDASISAARVFSQLMASRRSALESPKKKLRLLLSSERQQAE
jgi:transcriptional regulator with XRE-family HTH domain